MKKLLLIFIISCSVTSLTAQDTQLMKVSFKQASRSLFLSSVDTVYFKSPANEKKRIYFNISAADSVLKLDYVPIGKYLVEFISNGFYISPIQIVVCSKCSKEFEYFAAKKDMEKAGVFTWVEEMPRYKGGNLSLAKDFQQSLNKRDKKVLLQSANFSISFFVTKGNQISDITFSSADVSKQVKSIVWNGIMQAKSWEGGKLNGRPCDNVFTIDKQTLMK